jgi:hypothetical protein
MLDWLWARIMAAMLYPVHMLANKLVYSKIRSTVGISKVLYSVSVLCFLVDETKQKKA